MERTEKRQTDETHAQIRGVAARGDHNAGPARRHDVRTSGRSMPHLAAAQTANRKMNVFVGGKQSEASEHVDNPANANIPKEVFRGLRFALFSLWNFLGRHSRREGQLLSFHPNTT